MRHYILDADHHLVETDFETWAQWFEDFNNRIVDYTDITSQMRVSTVFIGLDHRFSSDGPPLVFETMIFGGPEEIDQTMWRYSSWDDATTGHKAAVRRARAAIKQKVKDG
jgi:hypothetical protein